MSRIQAIAATALCCLTVGFVARGGPTIAEELSILELGERVEVSNGESTAFAEVSDAELPSAETDVEFLPAPSREEPSREEPIDLPLQVDPDEPPPCDFCGCGSVVEPEDCYANVHHGWSVEVGASALQTQMAVSDLEAWPDDFGAAGRISLSYEWESGLGIRTQAWGYSMEGDLRSQSPLAYYYYDFNYYPFYLIPGAVNQLLYPQAYAYTRQIEVSAATVYLDIYKSIVSRHGELAIGMGPAFGNLEFNFQPAGDGIQYYGGGVSAFGQGYLPFVRRNRWELALAGQARVALLTGSWDVEMLSTDTEQSDSMSILELSVGPEFRFRIGPTANRHCFLQTLAEFQQWRSDDMGPVAGDTLGLQGVAINLGMLW